MEAKPLSQRTILFLVSVAGHWSLVLWMPAGVAGFSPVLGRRVMGRYITVIKVAGEGGHAEKGSANALAGVSLTLLAGHSKQAHVKHTGR